MSTTEENFAEAVAEALRDAREAETAAKLAVEAAEREHGAMALSLARAHERQAELEEQRREAKAAAVAAHVAAVDSAEVDTDAADAALQRAATQVANINGAAHQLATKLRALAEVLLQARVGLRLAEFRRLNFERLQLLTAMWPELRAAAVKLRQAVELDTRLRHVSVASPFATLSPTDFGKFALDCGFHGRDGDVARELRHGMVTATADYGPVRARIEEQLRSEARSSEGQSTAQAAE